MATIQTRLTSDNKQHDEAFKRSKQQVYNYNKQVDKSKASVLKFAKGGLGALGTALGVAGGAMAVFNKTMRASETTSDKFDNVMAQAKASVDYFFTSLSRGDFSGFLDGLKSVISQAKEARQAMDDLGDATLLTSAAGAKYARDRSELERKIKDPKTSDADRQAAQDQLNILRDEYIPELEIEAKKAWDAFYKDARLAFSNVGFMTPSDQLLTEFFSGNKGNDFWSTVYPQLKDITAEVRKNIVDLYKQANAAEQAVNQLYISDSRLERYGNTNTSSSYKPTKPTRSNDKISWISNRKYIESIFNSFSQVEPVLDEFGDTVYEKMEMPLERVGVSLDDVLDKSKQYAHESVKIIESEAEHAERLANIFDLQLNTINSLSSAFGALGDSFDIPGLKAAEIIGVAIANIAKAYSEASAKQAEGSITGWDWLAFSVAGIAQVASVIGQLHSLSGYAGGGIIGGNSYTGDKVLARVNSGEMILNPSQQANLFNMINGGVSTGGEVKFRIEGSTLVGVLNNYNKKVRRVM